jgi:hypothetical protein
MKAENQDCVKETLAWCNKQRVKQGKALLKRLPKGKQRDPLSCPCGEATGLKIGLSRYVPANQVLLIGAGKPLPAAVIRFVDLFDKGYFPEFIK